MNTFAPVIAARRESDQEARTNWEVLEGDAFDELDKVPDASCKLIVTSPPYNIGKEYERDIRKR
jgi:DNA modification methylase